MKALDVSVKPNLTRGLRDGRGRRSAGRARAARREAVDASAPTSSRGATCRSYDVIMTGVRAYERRTDLRAYNQRLLDYAQGRRHGDRPVQQVRVQRRAVRPVSRQGRPRARDRRERGDEAARAAASRCSTRPTRSAAPTGRTGCRSAACISSTTAGRDPQYTDLIEFTEPFPYNQGTKRGALVEAKVGQGRWIYVGLGLVAPAAGRHGRCIPADGEPAEPGWPLNRRRLEHRSNASSAKRRAFAVEALDHDS